MKRYANKYKNPITPCPPNCIKVKIINGDIVETWYFGGKGDHYYVYEKKT